MFHFTNPILHPPYPVYLSAVRPCDWECVISTERSGPAVLSVAVLCKVSLCVLKPGLNLTGEGWTRVSPEQMKDVALKPHVLQQPSSSRALTVITIYLCDSFLCGSRPYIRGGFRLFSSSSCFYSSSFESFICLGASSFYVHVNLYATAFTQEYIDSSYFDYWPQGVLYYL